EGVPAEPAKSALLRGSRLGLGKQRAAELDRILTGSVRQFVEEALRHERVGIAGGSTQRTGPDRQRLCRGVERVILNERLRKFRAVDRSRADALDSRALALGFRLRAVGHEVILPSDDLARGIQTRL